MYHKDLEKGADSPTTSTDGNNEVISPMVELQTPNTTVKLLSPSNRASSANGSDRLTIAIKKDSLKKRCKRFASMLMAVLLFGGGLALFISGAVIYSMNADSYATGMMVLGGVMVIPGIYGMTKIWKWWQKRQILLRKKARGHQNIDALIEEAEGEMD